MSASLDIRQVREGDLDEITRFRADMEGGAYLAALRTPPYYRWKYLEAGGGAAVGAFQDGRIHGLLAGFPRTIRAGETEVRAAELGEIFVDPDFQGRGLFKVLHEELQVILARRGVQAICCRPATGAGQILRAKFDYRKMLKISVGEFKLRSDRMPRPIPGVDIVEEEEVGADYDGLDKDLASDFAGTIRSAEYITRRYLVNPTPYTLLALRRGQRLEGWVVVLAVTREDKPTDGYVVDSLVWPDTGIRRSASAAAARWFTSNDCERVFAWRADGIQDPPMFAEPRPLSRLKKLDYVVKVIRPEARALLRKANAARWLFRMGDTDGI